MSEAGLFTKNTMKKFIQLCRTLKTFDSLTFENVETYIKLI